MMAGDHTRVKTLQRKIMILEGFDINKAKATVQRIRRVRQKKRKKARKPF